MLKPMPAAARFLNRLWLPIIALLSVGFVLLRWRYSPEYAPAQLERMVAGTADTPFQYRALVPFILRGLHWLGFAGSDQLADAAIDSLCVFGAALVMLRLCRRLAVPRSWALVLFWVLYCDYVLNMGEGVNFRLCYDMPALFLSFLSISLLHARRVVWFYLVLALALANRETAVFLTVVFGLTTWRSAPRRAWAGHIAIQLAMFAAMKLAMVRLFPGLHGDGAFSVYASDWIYTPWHPGEPIPTEIRLVENLVRAGRGELLPAFGFLWVPLLFVWRRIPDPFFKRAVWVVPIMLASLSLVANLSELRIFAEAVPIVLCCVAIGLPELRRPRGATGSQPLGVEPAGAEA